MERISPFVEAQCKVSNLDVNQAKTLVYYCIMTWSDQPQIRPLIDLHGESGTGKNSIMKQIKPWCRDPKWINARNITPAQLRDELADEICVFIEEADKTREPRLCENWYQQRFDETGKNVRYKKQRITRKESVYCPEETHNHFGYTILHTQNPFQGIELDRRLLRITLFKDSRQSYASTRGLDQEILAQIAKEVDWNSQIDQESSNSAWDVWLPLMRVAAHLRDEEFLDYAKGQIEKKTEEDDLTKVFEPKGVVFGEIAERYSQALKENDSRIAITDIRGEISNRGYMYNERQITQAARELGFTIVYPHNKAHIRVISKQQLKEIAERAGVAQNLDEELSNEADTLPVKATPLLSKN